MIFMNGDPPTAATVQRLGPAWASAYRTLMLQAYSLHPEAFTSSAEERGALPLSWWASRLSADERADEVVFGAVLQDALAGVVGLSFESRDKVRHKATLFGMAVGSPWRRHGIGGRLVAAALAHARARPPTRLVQLTVTEGNDGARSLYERAGFLAFGVEPCAMQVGGRFLGKVHMWCDLGLPAGAMDDNARRSPGPP